MVVVMGLRMVDVTLVVSCARTTAMGSARVKMTEVRILSGKCYVGKIAEDWGW